LIGNSCTAKLLVSTYTKVEKTLTCTYDGSMQLKIRIDELQCCDYAHSIKIEGVNNPSEGGTG